MMKRIVRHWMTCALLTATLVAPVTALAGYTEDAGMGTATVGANLLYVPAKLVYATLGGITGGFAYVLTGANYEVAERVWTPSLGGNYVVTPDHLRGSQPLYFSAPTTR